MTQYTFFQELIGLPPVLDFEASSLSDQSYPISAGLVVNGHVHYWVIRPQPQWTDWSAEAEGLHQLSRGYIEREGLPAETVYREMKACLSGASLAYSDAAEWERQWLAVLGDPMVSISDARTLIPPYSVASFSDKKAEAMRRHHLKAHRADHDALAIAMAVRQLKQNLY